MASYSAVNGSSRQDLHEVSGAGQNSSGPATPSSKRGISPWIKFGVPIFILVVIGAVLGGVLGSRAARHPTSNSSATAGGAGNDGSPAAASSAISAKNAIGRFPTATNSEWMMPVYPSTTNAAAFTTPTFNSQQNIAVWPSDSFQPSNPQPTSVRSDRPRIIAPKYKWDALPNLISADPYLKQWNDTIFGNASDYTNQPLVQYFMDGSSGILDVARQVKERIKALSYAYRMSNDTKWADRAYQELLNAGSTSWGPATDKWNNGHFLDSAELSAAFGIAYDWLYDYFNSTQKQYIRNTMIQWGLGPGRTVFEGDPNGFGWWSAPAIKGNWNCVCNGGLTVAALAILGDDTSGTAEVLLANTINSAKQACALAPSNDGTWAETANYWYFGTTGYAEMTSSLQTAAGSDFGLLSAGSGINNTGLFHMYVTGMTSLFNYGDHGPNKYSTTANAMMFLANQFDEPRYMLFQRDQWDSADPWSMFWYDPSVTGAFWNGMPLDHYFDNSTDQWASMRSSWTDDTGLYVAVKAGMLRNHQTHNDLDCGDFVLDALGTRWAGELGSGDYLSTGYFTTGDGQDSQRWLYYRKRTEGQNTILVGGQNQNVSAAPTVRFGSTGEAQGSSTVYTVPDSSAACFVADLTSAYFNVTSFKRGVRTINARKQVLIQDEITASDTVMWRMHTNATVSISGTTATLRLDGQTLQVVMLNPPSGANFTTMNAVRLPTDPALPSGNSDQPNPGVTVLVVELPAGQYTLQMLFNPQWPGMSASDFKTPSSVALDNWSLTSPS
ncbi:chondroitin AC/alginate lyase [Vararia minispora EC-137]|uniref:Chondroitin AC/alginate lyase n=1 Tax=Vararia minispora EC-137 TaxID=1314806 RepID=A0ACB8QEW6_9AGAM|nr:chondroitin AC/alginate lyase [Vararia minispora EC-137]